MALPIAIIGAGLAGISAARALIARGHAVTIFDKGRGPGGRLATRRIEAEGRKLQFDHGAQYLRAESADFASALTEAGTAPWPDAARRVGVPSMSAMPRALLGNIPCVASRHVGQITGQPGAWTLRHWDARQVRPGKPLPDSAPEEAGPFAAALLTMPATQAREVLGRHAPRLHEALAAIRYAPCWTVMAAFNAPLALPETLRPEAHAIGWAARDSAKPGRDARQENWVIQAGPAWTRAYLELPAEDIAQPLLAALANLSAAPLPAPFMAVAHRWRYSLLEAPLGEPCLWDAAMRLGYASDGCIGGRAEAAWQSGAALAARALA
ncbi:MAG: FAD-dependent oxidoreductase [Acetobacteraceae bacterium]|jgi:renalase|nr:FAD-dependent oxidoreductase [Acetobacteraceae bacterium]